MAYSIIIYALITSYIRVLLQIYYTFKTLYMFKFYCTSFAPLHDFNVYPYK